MKNCNKCGESKPAKEFYKDKHKVDGLCTTCKSCKLASVRKYKSKNRKKLAEKQRRYRPDNIESQRARERDYSLRNSDARDRRVAMFYAQNPEKKKEYESRYLAKPEVKARLNEKSRKYINRKRGECYLFRLKLNCRSRLHAALRGVGASKKSRTFEIIGCSPDELCIYLQSRFKDGMSWDNYGEWHVDHIVPLASAKTESEVIALCHYTNLQPLWADENLSKGAKIL